MASRVTLSAARFLICIRTTGPLRPPTLSSQIRTITSYHGLLGAAKLQPVSEILYPEEEEEKANYLGLFEEAVDRWQSEAQKMRENMLLPEDLEHASIIENASRDQLKDLMEAVANDELLDIRRGWVIGANY